MKQKRLFEKWSAPTTLMPCIESMNPPLTPPRRGTDRTPSNACSPPGRGRGWVGSWVEAPIASRMHWDHEPVWAVPAVRCPAFRRSGPAKAGTPNGRFMERERGRARRGG